MSISFVGSSASAGVGTSSISVAYPAGIAAGQLLLLCVANKYPNNSPATPAGWSLISNAQQSGGAGSAGIDTGTVYSTVFIREADGSETGSVTVSITSGNSAIGRMFSYQKAAGTIWSYAAANGSMNTQSTTLSITFNVDPGIIAADVVVVSSALNTDGATFTSHGLSGPGIGTKGTSEKHDAGTTQGQDCGLLVNEFNGFNSANSSGVQTYAVAATAAVAGAAVLVRLREATTSIPNKIYSINQSVNRASTY